MNKRTFGLGATAAAGLLALSLATPGTAHAGVCNVTAEPDFGPVGSGPLQTVLDNITQGGPSSVNVATDCLGDGGDSLWHIGGSGGSISTLVIEIAGFAGSNSFGVWDAANPMNTVQVFAGADAAGLPPAPPPTPTSQHTLNILADGSVFVDSIDSGVDFAGNTFGFYLDATTGNGSPNGFFYSDTSLNADGIDHMYAYEGKGDTIQLLPFAAGPWGSNEYILAFEDLIGPCTNHSSPGLADCDYTDFVVLIESVSPVPEPASVALAGLGLLAVGYTRRRRQRAIR